MAHERIRADANGRARFQHTGELYATLLNLAAGDIAGVNHHYMQTTTMSTYKTSNRLTLAARAILAAGALAAPAGAANSAYTVGDLVLAFQQEGGSNTVYVTLGNTATQFRGAAAGADAPNKLNIININSQLTAAFGSSWASQTNIYAGLSGVWGTAGGLNNSLQNGDPNRTLYVSQSRTTLGAPDTAGSTGWVVGGDGAMSSGANAMVDLHNVFATGLVSDLDSDTFADEQSGAALVSPVGFSRIDDNNPFLGAGIQGNAFGIFGGGVQQAGTASTLGNMGPVQDIEFALDLYRILAKTNAPGQVGGVLRQGSYEGTVVLDSLGNVSFMTVPEPSATALFAIAGGATLLRRRRKN